IGARECLRRRALVADNENTSTDTEETAPVAETEDATDVVAPETPAESEPEAEPESDLPRFAAPFSSPEPTAVVARPRRRATRSVIAADPDSVEAPAPAPVAPALITFVAPSETDVAPPRRGARRRGRRRVGRRRDR